jgi:hypothetical protein
VGERDWGRDADELRARLRGEWRAEQEAAARDAVEAWAQGRALVDVLRDHMHRGDTLAVTVGGVRFTGVADEVGADLLALRTAAGRVDVQLAPTVPVLVEVAGRAARGGHRGADVAGGSFRQALVRRAGADVVVGVVGAPEPLAGRLAVGADHVTVATRGGPDATVALAHVAWARAADPGA